MAPTSSAPPTAPPDTAAPIDSAAATAALFSPDYITASARFRAAARSAGATIESLSIDARGPANEELTIDIAWLGSRNASRVLLHVTGVHGIEAFADSATQLALLAAPPGAHADSALVFVHVLNPYGMAWLRRANEHNVDLNRNFLPDDAAWTGVPPLYGKLDALLNPQSSPARDGFRLRLALRGLRHGVREVRQAIAHGQHLFPKGLFYGGAGLQQGPRLFCEWLQQSLGNSRSVLAIDMHTGLGPHGASTLIRESGVGLTPCDVLETALGQRVLGGTGIPVPYSVRGSLGSALPRLLEGIAVEFVLQEIGTWPALQVLHALREENRWHHYGNSSPEHASKRRLREALNPASPGWRNAAVAHGRNLVYRAADWFFREAQQ